ncbi:TonB-dependent receptor plug domain-containing protein [Pseudoxanthomonas wuyuanensis]|uniref:TonB-dependent Receptor Plug Domain n=1 Tax=Pseudoxanthomonas wuyuanensis TaxID=1073196 RepID=A0A286D477_9GAMM|nr:TonB-dependent receptor [Pseudoxanthomonas wuyuanensis]KAF1717238.1 TonB-dependent receptor [Pseudoxanthomonas wuyuanensis]SOD53473.1 TonB-dependent Receptor Plug Domain [Pseudoxanthomonas wuyuanensis]
MNQKTTKLREAISFALAVSTASIASTGAVFAQEASNEAKTLDTIEVTGSRIKRADMETSSPVFTIDRQTIENSGAATVGEFLQRSPAISGAATNPQVNNGGGAGAATVDLRGLGVNRTLVLVDGRRWIGTVSNANGAVDINSIPMGLIERVEILKDGASAIYGSDAIGGVVNFILRKNFDGLEASAFYGVSSRGDANTERYDAIFGMTGERGRLMLGASYDQEDSVSAADRAYSSQPYQLYAGEHGIGGTSRILTGRYVVPRSAATGVDLTDPNCGAGSNVVLTRIDGSPGSSQSDFRCFNPSADVYNFQADGNLNLTPQERTALFLSGNYQISDNVEAFLLGSWLRTDSAFFIAPLPFDGRAAVDNVPISADSIYNPFGVDITDARLRLRDFIPTRTTRFETETYQITAGLRGAFGDSSWTWDASYGYGRTPQSSTVRGYLYSPALTEALGPSMIDPATGNPICVRTPGDAATAIPGCLPVNFMGPAPDPNTPAGQAQLAALDLINPTIHNTNENVLKVFSANVTGDLFELPAGMMSLAVGVERREESASSSSDFLTIIPPGETVCKITQEACTFGDINGSFDVNEIYAEALIPVLSDMPFAEKLNVSLGTRYSDYSNFGDTTNSKIGVEWKPVSDLLVRATYADVFRAPTIGDLFAPTVPSANTYTDPCNGYTGQATADPRACAGVPTDGSFRQSNSQVTSFQVANPNLQPEQGDVLTYGFVYSPSWLEGFSVTVDYWRVKLDDFITNLPENVMLNQCYSFGRFCDTFVRDDSGDVAQMTNLIGNFGTMKTSGVDIGLRYLFPETSWGRFSWNLDSTYLAEYDVRLLAGDPSSDVGAFPGIPESSGLAGTFVDSTSSGFGNLARWRALNDISWRLGNVSASLTTRYVHHVYEAPDVADVTEPGYVAKRRVPSFTQTDFQIGYRFEGLNNSSIQIGVRNLTDRQPPLVYSGFNASTDMRTYDAIGRFYWMRWTARF